MRNDKAVAEQLHDEMQNMRNLDIDDPMVLAWLEKAANALTAEPGYRWVYDPAIRDLIQVPVQ